MVTAVVEIWAAQLGAIRVRKRQTVSFPWVLLCFFLHECWEKKSVFLQIKSYRQQQAFAPNWNEQTRALVQWPSNNGASRHAAGPTTLSQCGIARYHFNVSSKVTLSIFQFSPSQTFRLRQTHRQSVFNKGIFDYQSQSPLLQAKLVHLRKIQFLGIYNQRQEKDFGQKLLMYKIQHDGYTSLYYSAQLKFTLWKG